MAQTSHSLDMGGGGNTVQNSSVPVATTFVVVVWVKPTSLGTIVVCGQGSHWRLQLTGGGNPRFNDGTADNTFSTLTIATGSWTAIALEVTGTVAKCSVRPSGGSTSSETINPTNAVPSGGTMLGVGDYAFSSFTMSGLTCYLSFYSSTLSGANVSGLLDGTVLPGSLTPTVFYKTDDGSGTNATDSSGNGYTGTITGPTWSTDVPTELAGSPPTTIPNRIFSFNQAVKAAAYY